MEKKRNVDITADAIMNNGSKQKIYINESLTKENKQLLFKTKEKARDASYKYVWSKEGKIFVRKNDNSRVHRIKNEHDLVTL